MTADKYIVVSEKRGASSRPSEHTSIDSATQEASRLSGLAPDDRFFIYKAVRIVSAPRVIIEDLWADEPPF